MNRRGFVVVWIVLIIVIVLAVAAGGVWYWTAHKSNPNPSQSQSATTVQTTSTYQNTDYGVSFDYPNNWTVKLGDTAEGDYGLYTQYGPQYAPTAISLITVEIPPSLYPGTNFEGGYFNLSVDKQLSQNQCLALLPQFGPNNILDKKITVDGVVFTRHVEGGVAAGTYTSTENYSGYTSGICYEFNLGDTTGNDVSPTGTRMSGSADDISALEGVLSSVKFTSSVSSSGNNKVSPSAIDTSVWKTWNGIFKYPSDWEEIPGEDIPILADFIATPDGSPTSSASVEYGSVHMECGKNYGADEATSSIVISGKIATRVDTTGSIEIYYCDLAAEQVSLGDGEMGHPATEWQMQLGYDSSTTKAIDEAIISTLK